MLCPNCKRKFPDGESVCPDCKFFLAEEPKDADEKTDNGEDLGALMPVLFNINEFEAEQAISLLRGYGIPAFKRHEGPTRHMSIVFGSAVFGVDVVVPQKKFEDAQNLLNAGIDLEDWEENTGEKADE